MVAPTVWARIRAELDRSGWRQYGGFVGHIHDHQWETGPCCLLQAAGRVPLDDEDEWRGMYDRMVAYIGDEAVGDWNDHPGRTLADVHALLDTLDAEDRAA